MNKLMKTFFKEKTLEIFLNIEEGYAAKIRNKADCMYSYVITCLKNFEALGLVISEKKGRITNYELTEKGKRLQKLFLNMQKDMKEKRKKGGKKEVSVIPKKERKKRWRKVRDNYLGKEKKGIRKKKEGRKRLSDELDKLLERVSVIESKGGR